ncbi:MAG: hydrogenase formation protein HypD [Polyangiales bacterium]
MKFVDEWRDASRAKALAERVRHRVTQRWRIMEVCGGQTHTIARFGIERLLPEEVTLVHGPGCPVCVTPVSTLDYAGSIAERPGVILCSYGDMLRVPSSRGDLLASRARGADVRVVTSALDAVALAERERERTVVFFAVGFETTAPMTAVAIEAARARGLRNFAVLAAHVRVPPVLAPLFSAQDTKIDGLLAAGHVCAVMGTSEYPEIAQRFQRPIVVTGFEPVDILEGVARCVDQLEARRHEVEIQYTRAVRPEGNPAARAAIERVFEPSDSEWRGFGVIPLGALSIRSRFAEHDARARFEPPSAARTDASDCRASDVLRGRIAPRECPHFGTRCTPESPLGAPMVSTEGACAAYVHLRRR